MNAGHKKKERMALKIISWIILIAVLSLWQWAADAGKINVTIMASPSRIWEKFIQMLTSGALAKYVIVSLLRVVKGFLIGGGLGLFLGLLLGLSWKFETVMDLFIGIFRPIPPIAWIPFLILLFGIGETSKVVVIAIGSFWPLLLNTLEGVKGVDRQLLELGDVLEKDTKTKIVKLILPSAIPSIFTGMRLAVSRAWSCVVTAEMIAASAGIGYLIQYAREMSQPGLMFVGVATIGLIGLLIDWLMAILQKKLLYWYM